MGIDEVGINLQNKSGYRAGTRPSVFREGRVIPDYDNPSHIVTNKPVHVI